MIFITVGSQKFQFNRLLIYIDNLLEKHVIQEEVFAQVGYSDYKPKNYIYKDFLNREEFNQIMSKSNIVITHGGTSAIMGGVKAGKKVIAVPRLCKYGEHVDNHQEQIINRFISSQLIIGVNQLEDTENALYKCSTFPLKTYYSNTKAIIDSIDKYIIEN